MYKNYNFYKDEEDYSSFGLKSKNKTKVMKYKQYKPDYEPFKKKDKPFRNRQKSNNF